MLLVERTYCGNDSDAVGLLVVSDVAREHADGDRVLGCVAAVLRPAPVVARLR